MDKTKIEIEYVDINGLKPNEYNPKWKICFACGVGFIKNNNLRTKKHFCSRKCWSKFCVENLGSWIKSENISKRNKEEWFRKRVSEGLQRHFKKNPRQNEQWYIDRYGKDYIPKKLKHVNAWKNFSKLLRDKYYCQRCGSKDDLSVHHIIPFAISRDNSINNLVVLCRSCHKFTEDNNLKIFDIVGNWEILRILYKDAFLDVGKPIRYRNV